MDGMIPMVRRMHELIKKSINQQKPYDSFDRRLFKQVLAIFGVPRQGIVVSANSMTG